MIPSPTAVRTDSGMPKYLPLFVAVVAVLATAATVAAFSTLESKLRGRLLVDVAKVVADARTSTPEDLERMIDARLGGSARAVVRNLVPLAGEPTGVWNEGASRGVAWGFMPLRDQQALVLIKVSWPTPYACVGSGFVLAFALATMLTCVGLGLTTLLLCDRLVIGPLRRHSSELGRQAKLGKGLEVLAHDVRKPFSLVKSLLETIGRRPEPQALRALTHTMLPELEATLRRVDAMIADVLAYGRTTAPELAPITLGHLIEVALRDVAGAHPRAEVKLAYRLRHSRRLNGDEVQLARVFANIIGNAVEAMRACGEIWIRSCDTTHAGRPAVEVTIGNGGSFIPPATLARLFEPFFTTGKAGGTGLGLASARQTIDRHGGRIRVASDAEAGTEFTVVIPAVTGAGGLAGPGRNLPDDLAGAAATTSPSGLEQNLANLEHSIRHALATTACRPVRLLVVDDDLAVRATIPELLRSIDTRTPLAAVTAVATWAQGKKFMSQHPVDIVLCDYGLGQGSPNGIEILQKLRECGFTGRFLLHTDRTLSAPDQSVLERLGDGFVLKPAAKVQLLQLVADTMELFGTTATITKDAENPIIDLQSVKPRVIVVDDDCFVRELWQLQRDVEAMTFAYPEDFLEAARTDDSLLSQFDAIVLDYYYGEGDHLDGPTFARRLKGLTAIPLVLASDLPASAPVEPGTYDARIGKDTLSWPEVQKVLGL